MNQVKPKLIHIASIQVQNQGRIFLFLRKLEDYRYIWFQVNGSEEEKETSIWGGTAEEAILAARKVWKESNFQTLNCGFRYTLPERDEVGTNALFHQMAESYASSSGVYFDEELGSNCIVQNASIEARNFIQRLNSAQ